INNEDIIAEEQIYEKWRARGQHCDLIQISPAMIDNEPLWEITYKDDDMYTFHYVSMIDGTMSERLQLTQMFKQEGGVDRMKLSKRVQTLTPSSTLAISAKAQALKKSGEDVISLGVGEPDFNTPAFIIEAAVKAMKDGQTKYTPSGGIVELKEAIARKFKHDNHLDYTLDEIIVTTGAKHALYTAFQAILD